MEIENFFKVLIEISDKLFLVGGSVRDYLLKNDCYDYDFAIKDRTIEIGKLLANKTQGSFFVLDYERQTVRVVWNINGKLFNFDIARIIGDKIEDDLILRDLTLNSIALEINNDNYKAIVNLELIDNKYIIDPTNGKSDLGNKIIKTYQKQNLIDDPLRMLRAFRFSAKFKFDIDQDTLIFIKQLSKDINKVAKERILKELYDILFFNHSHKSFQQMLEYNLLQNIFDNNSFDINKFGKAILLIKEFENTELSIFGEFQKNIEEYLNTTLILNRTINQTIKLAILFANLKKDQITNNQYIKHLEIYLKNFTFSVIEQKFILKTVRFFINIDSFNSLSFERKDLYLFFKETKEELISSCLLIYISDNQDLKKKVLDVLKIYFNDKILSIQPEIINGEEIMKKFNLKPGRIIGELLEKVKQSQAENLIFNFNQAIDFLALEINN